MIIMNSNLLLFALFIQATPDGLVSHQDGRHWPPRQRSPANARREQTQPSSHGVLRAVVVGVSEVRDHPVM